MPRLFVAVELPEQVKAELSRLARRISGARCVGASELHLTLRFIGEVDEASVALIKKALSDVRFSSFPLALKGVGHFPPHGQPRVLWVGLETHPELIRLQQQVEDALQRAGLPPETRGFSPHITLARFKEPRAREVAAFEAEHKGLAYPPTDVTEFILFSSVLSPKGATHTRECVYCC